MWNIDVQVKNMTDAMLYLNMVQQRLQNDRRAGLVKAVNRIGEVWKDNFDSEGSKVGGWAALEDYTQRYREYLGYDASHPILRRDGALYEVAIEMPAQAHTAESRSIGDRYSSQQTTSSLSVTNGVATIQAHGWKVANQYDTTGDQYGHKARPFWFVDKSVLNAAKGGVVDWLVNEVLRP